MAEKLMMLSLDDAKRVSKALSNETAVQILSHLADHEASETQIAQALDMPLSTVHYNVKQLVDAGLLIAEEFHYSEKGKEVNHYKLANKYIVIAPKKDDSFMERMRNYLPAFAIAAGAAIILKAMQVLSAGETASATLRAESAEMFAADMAMAAAPVVQKTPWWLSPAIDYTLIGVAGVFAIILLVESIRFWRR